MASYHRGEKGVPESPENGKFICVVGPTCAGKTTFVERLVLEGYGRRQTTCTTRPARPGEEDGKDYFFLTREAFLRRRQEGLFLESAEVHGHFYGTPKAPILESLSEGGDVICAIDVQGLRQVKAHQDELIRYGLFSVFIYASLQTVERRLRARSLAQGKEVSPEEFAARLASAQEELKAIPECQAVVVNDRDGEEYIATAFERLKAALNLRGRLMKARPESRPWHQIGWTPRSGVAA